MGCGFIEKKQILLKPHELIIALVITIIGGPAQYFVRIRKFLAGSSGKNKMCTEQKTHLSRLQPESLSISPSPNMGTNRPMVETPPPPTRHQQRNACISTVLTPLAVCGCKHFLVMLVFAAKPRPPPNKYVSTTMIITSFLQAADFLSSKTSPTTTKAFPSPSQYPSIQSAIQQLWGGFTCVSGGQRLTQRPRWRNFRRNLGKMALKIAPGEKFSLYVQPESCQIIWERSCTNSNICRQNALLQRKDFFHL